MRVLTVKDSHMIAEITKCDKVVNTKRAELLHGPPMISHVIPKVFKKIDIQSVHTIGQIMTL